MINMQLVPKFCHIYRESKLAETLMIILDNYVKKNLLSASVAYSMINQFDISILEALKKRTEARVKIKGSVRNYKNIQNIWIFHVENAQLSIEADTSYLGHEK